MWPFKKKQYGGFTLQIEVPIGSLFRKKPYEELTLQIGGWEKVKVPIESQCRHQCVLACEDSLTDFAYCNICGLRTPSVPYDNYAWAGEMFRRARDNGKLFRDPSNLHKIYVLDSQKNTIEPILAYLYGESKKRKRK